MQSNTFKQRKICLKAKYERMYEYNIIKFFNRIVRRKWI